MQTLNWLQISNHSQLLSFYIMRMSNMTIKYFIIILQTNKSLHIMYYKQTNHYTSCNDTHV